MLYPRNREWSGDPLDDMEVSPELQSMLTLIAAISFLKHFPGDPDRLLKLYDFTLEEVHAYMKLFPQHAPRAQAFLDAYEERKRLTL
jgi:hypothetical protein